MRPQPVMVSGLMPISIRQPHSVTETESSSIGPDTALQAAASAAPFMLVHSTVTTSGDAGRQASIIAAISAGGTVPKAKLSRMPRWRSTGQSMRRRHRLR